MENSAPTTTPTTGQRLAAEALGTLVVVFVGSAAVLGNFGGDPLTYGLALVAVTYAFGRYTGGHFNPSVSIGSALAGRTAWGQAGSYIGAQVAGGIGAGVLLLLMGLGSDGFDAFDTVLGANGWGDDGTGYALWAALLLTVILTALFVLAYLGLTDERNEHLAFAPLGIGVALYAVYAASDAATGGTVNLAQSLGTALFSGADPLIQVWVFLIGTAIGAGAAGLLYPALFGRAADPVPGSGLNFGGSSAPGPQWGQQWGQQGGQQGYPQGAQGYPVAGAPGGYVAPVAAPEPPIIQDGWQWDPQAQQWIPAQQPAADPGAWAQPGSSSGEQTAIRPGDQP